MKNIGILILILFSLNAFSQTTLKGKVVDYNTGEGLIGATIIYGKGQGIVTDLDGRYSISIPEGERSLQVS